MLVGIPVLYLAYVFPFDVAHVFFADMVFWKLLDISVNYFYLHN